MKLEPRKLDPLAKQKVSYCIPLKIRDEQILSNIARIKGRLEGGAKREDPIAVVCFGPSLTDTWERIRDFKYTITCSGAHKFLIDHGIIPSYHIDVDPRAHKCALIGTPHPDVQYLIASTCHADVFKLLEGYNVKLWHIFDNEDEGRRILPRGEVALTGGCGAGLRAIMVAAFLGFRDLHVFGLDGNVRNVNPTGDGFATAETHGADHPNKPPGFFPCEFNGKTYYTTPAYLEQARMTGPELDQLPAVKTTFYGEGLVQDMMKLHVPKPDHKAVHAFSKPLLITPDYRDMNAQLHRDNVMYGIGGEKHAKAVISLVERFNFKSVLDYGCGKGMLAKSLPFPIWEYDPAIPGKDMDPKPADLVVCTDVLEHIEPETLKYVLDDLRRVTVQMAYLVINTGPAKKTLPDGRNTHLIQQGKQFWRRNLERYFDIAVAREFGPELHFAATKKNVKSRQKLTTHAIV